MADFGKRAVSAKDGEQLGEVEEGKYPAAKGKHGSDDNATDRDDASSAASS